MDILPSVRKPRSKTWDFDEKGFTGHFNAVFEKRLAVVTNEPRSIESDESLRARL